MGSITPLKRRPPTHPEVYQPINFRPTERCATMRFDPSDGNGYEDRFDAEGIQYALDEKITPGYHVVETPDGHGPLIRYLSQRPNGTVCVMERKNAGVCLIYPSDAVHVVGFIFQFIKDFETGDRWEYVRGPAHEGERETFPELFTISGHLG